MAPVFRLPSATLSDDHDFVVVDTATGISDAVIDVVGLTDYALVVTADEPAALVDAYATIKLLTEADRAKPVGVLVNATADADDADRVYKQLSRAARRFLDRSLRDDGYIVEDKGIRGAALDHDGRVRTHSGERRGWSVFPGRPGGASGGGLGCAARAAEWASRAGRRSSSASLAFTEAPRCA